MNKVELGRRRKNDLLLPEGVYRHGKKFRRRVYEEGKPGWETYRATTVTGMLKEHTKGKQLTENIVMRDIFARYVSSELPKKASATQRSDRAALKCLSRIFADARPRDITPAMIVAYVDGRSPQAPVRVNRETAVLSHVFTKCRHWGILEENPAQKLRYRNPEAPRTRYVEDRELRIAMRMAPAPIRYAMWLCVVTGLRRKDLLAVQWEDFSEEGLTVTLSKSRRRGAVPKTLLFCWSPSLRKLHGRLQAREPMRTHDASFLGIDTAEYENAWTVFQNLVVKTGIPRFQMKDLRAKYGTDLAESGGDPTKNLAHSSATTTRRHYQRKPVKIT